MGESWTGCRVSLACQALGAIFTNAVPPFNINSERVLPAYLEWLCRRASEGTANRVRLKEDRFLDPEISLRPTPKQQRIVARNEDAVEQIDIIL